MPKIDKNRVRIEQTSEKNQVKNHQVFCADPVSQKIEKMSAPERSADLWASKITAQMAVGRGVGGKVNSFSRGNRTQEMGNGMYLLSI